MKVKTIYLLHYGCDISSGKFCNDIAALILKILNWLNVVVPRDIVKLYISGLMSSFSHKCVSTLTGYKYE